MKVIQYRIEIILTLPLALVAHTDVFLRENNHYNEIKHKSRGSWWVSCGVDNVRERRAIIKERNWKNEMCKSRNIWLSICNVLFKDLHVDFEAEESYFILSVQYLVGGSG